MPIQCGFFFIKSIENQRKLVVALSITIVSKPPSIILRQQEEYLRYRIG